MDYDFVGQIIKKYRVNVLLGMPSYLIQMLEHNRQWLTQEKLIEKIFYGGEAFSSSQIEKLKNEFGVTVIKSASYGSVDMGPLGFQCPFSDNKTYHLHQNIHHLEILKLDSLSPAGPDELGRLVFSTHCREDQSLMRYDVGDLGKWVKDACPCGRKSPRFELLGRFGDIFRAAGTFLNYNHIVNLLSEKLGVSSELQVELLKSTSKEEMVFYIATEADEAQRENDFLRSLKVRGLSSMEEVMTTFLSYYFELNDLVTYEKVLDVKIKLVRSDQLQRSAASGKLVHIVDKRNFS